MMFSAQKFDIQNVKMILYICVIFGIVQVTACIHRGGHLSPLKTFWSIPSNVISLHASTRGEVISSVIVIIVNLSTKIIRSRDVGVLVSGQYCQDVINGKNAISLSF